MALVLGGLQTYIAERVVVDEPLPECPAQRCTGACPHPAVATPTPTPTAPYTLVVRQTGRRDQTVTWPHFPFGEGARLQALQQAESRPWYISAQMREASKDQVKVHLELKTVCPNTKEMTVYKGAFDCKVGVCHLTALTEKTGTEPLAVSVCVKQAEDKPTRSVVAVAPTVTPRVPMPAPTPIAPVWNPIGDPLVVNGKPVLPNPVPMPMPVPAVPPHAVFAFAMREPMKTITLKIEDGETKLSYQSPDLKTASSQLTLDLPHGSLNLKAAKGHIVVKGQDFTAQATKVQLVGDRVQLVGEVSLRSDKIGPGAEVKADSLTVRMQNGGFAELVPVRPGMGMPSIPVNTPATMPPCTPGGVCPPDCCPGGMCPVPLPGAVYVPH
jgi:hypothetical protein